jgi:hypothetical protein
MANVSRSERVLANEKAGQVLREWNNPAHPGDHVDLADALVASIARAIGESRRADKER